jgi:hypothetical protein
MSKHAEELLQEMRSIFGRNFSGVLTEAARPMPRSEPSKGGLLTKKKGGIVPSGRGEKKGGMTIGAKKVMKAAAKAARENPKHKAKQADDEKKFQDAMRDIRGEMDKSQKKSAEKKAAGERKAARPAAAAGGSSHSQNPFKNAKTIGLGPRKEAKRSETKCWKCGCEGGTYAKEGCKCTSSGSGKNCPPAGTVKMIKIKKDYHQQYNRDHHDCTNRAGVKVDCGSRGRQ